MVKVLALVLSLASLPSGPEGPEGTEEMSVVPAGEFWMGRYRLWLIDEIGWQTEIRMDDRPMHLVELDAFAIDRTEVTNAEYARFVEATGHRPPFHWRKGDPPHDQPRLPVYNVSWEDARAYCAWAGKRLPTEAEWEKAARGGLEKKAFPWGDVFEPPAAETKETELPSEGESEEEAEVQKMAHYGYPEGPTEVARFPPNGYGLYDMVGNVWEWVEDGYELHYYSVSPHKSPEGPEKAPYRVLRGGSWADEDDRLLSVFYRNFSEPGTRVNTIGFRCARSLDADEP